MSMRKVVRGASTLLAASVVFVSFAHCSSDEPATPVADGGGIDGAVTPPAAGEDAATLPDAAQDAAPPPLLGRSGDPCTDDTNCESALRCIAGTCARAAAGDTGRPCLQETDCSAGVCLDLGDGRKVCSTACSDPSGCAPGWACGGDAGPNVCTCAPRAEACNGADDDCDGIIDNADTSRVTCLALDPNYHCLDTGSCGCRLENQCAGTCVADTRSNLAHCGTCGNACPSGAACNQGACACPAERPTACDGTCVDTQVNASACGGCGNVCQTGIGCAQGNCNPVVAVTRGWGTCVTLASGAVGCMDGNFGSGLRPQPALQGARVALGGGGSHGCAAMPDGSAACWGNNNRGQAGRAADGISDTTPQPVAGVAGVVSLAIGQEHTCALLQDRTVSCWGGNDHLQLGMAFETGSQWSWARYTPALVPGVVGVVALAAGGDQTCALLEAGTLTCWGGQDVPGALPDGRSQGLPADAGLAGVKAVGLGQTHGCVVMNDTTLRCWGMNQWGEVGLGDVGIDHRHVTATTLPGIQGVTAIALGNSNSCALFGNGTVQCWGAGGALGVGDANPRYVPTPVLGVADATGLPGAGSSCAIRTGGALWCWTQTPTLVSTRISGL